ncbi:MAG: carotenoid 1,2-hydratase [Burkholderiales bacterium]|nr:carotenoid 1,2-hydratase [Burkholderiales bacterium]
MFSPYYARARRRSVEGIADPLNHCALNVVLYGRGAKRWSMTERGREQVHCDATTLQIGPSALHWNGDTLTIEIDEISVPWPSRLRGVVKLHAAPLFDHPVLLSAPGGHRWFPIAPSARVEVDLSAPALRWSGPAYLDSNRGDAPLEQAFTRWDWARAHLSNGRSAVLYDVDRVAAEPLAIGLEFHANGAVNPIEPPRRAALPNSRWGVARAARSEGGAPMRVVQTLTDAPFYARSLVDTRWLGEPVTAMHESLSLQRFDSAWVQALLPFRMPRITRG